MGGAERPVEHECHGNLFVIPILTMRLFAEEKRSGTFELLSTSPLRDWEIILGKWLAAMVLYLVELGVSVLNMLVLFAYGNPDWRPMAVGYLGVILQGGCLLAIGTFLSTLTKNQIIAGDVRLWRVPAAFRAGLGVAI